ncbi:S8 family peptidase [Chloroflexota bacterium]
MSVKRSFRAVVILLALALACGLAVPGLSASVMVKVIVTFDHQPQAADLDLITDLGGVIKRTYRIVPVVAASLPEENIPALEARSMVVDVDIDVVVQAMAETLPWGVDRIDAEQVHAFNKGAGVKVAVLDTGIDLDHPDLLLAGDVTFVEGTTSGDDDNGHGTKVAGVIAALDNEIGVVGVAPEVELYSVKVLNDSAIGDVSDILAGIEWAVENRMDVMNMSFASYLQFPASVHDAIELAYDTGILMVAGAGNNGNPEGTGDNITYPARYSEVIAVGGTDAQDNRWAASSTGPALELMAPGVSVETTAIGGYGTLTGTSIASPHTTGVGALLIASLMESNQDVRQRMRQTVEDLGDVGWDSLYGYGLVDAGTAVQQTPVRDEYVPPVTTIDLSGTAGVLGWYRSDVTVTISAEDNDGGSGVAVIKYSLNAGDTWLTYTEPFDITTEGAALVLAKSWDNAGNTTFLPEYKEVLIDKTPPTASISPIPDGFWRQGPHEIMGVTVYGSAEDNAGGSGLQSTVFWDVQDSTGLWEPPVEGFNTVVDLEIWCTTENRVYTFTVVATDYAGNETIAQGTTTIYKKL